MWHGQLGALFHCLAHPRRRELMANLDPVARDVVAGIRRSAGRIDMTDAYYAAAQQAQRAVALALGPSSFFFNVNPSAMHCYAVTTAAGETVCFDATGRPEQIETVITKWQRAKNNPVACMALMVAVEEAILEHIFGVRRGDQRQFNRACFCGTTFRVATKIEETGRKELHLHGEAHVAAFCVERLQQLFQGPNCRVLALAHAVCAAWYPDPYFDPTHPTQAVFPAGAAPPNTPSCQPPRNDSEAPIASYRFDVLANCNESGAPDINRQANCADYHAAVCKTALTHSHTDTCKRHGKDGTEGSCGMKFGRVLRSEFRWIGEEGTFLLPRFGTHLVPHMPGLAMALGCNQLMSLPCEVDRDFTTEVAGQFQVPRDQREALPIEAPAIDRATEASEYNSKYISKASFMVSWFLGCRL